MRLSVTLNLDIRDDRIRKTFCVIECLECSLCHRHIQKGNVVINAFDQTGNRLVWLCPDHIPISQKEIENDFTDTV